VRHLAPIFATVALAAALTGGAGAQQQTFYTAHAGPTGPVPVITPQPLPSNYYYGGGCAPQSGNKKPPRGSNPCIGNGHRPSPHPSGRPPKPRPT